MDFFAMVSIDLILFLAEVHVRVLDPIEGTRCQEVGLFFIHSCFGKRSSWRLNIQCTFELVRLKQSLSGGIVFFLTLEHLDKNVQFYLEVVTQILPHTSM